MSNDKLFGLKFEFCSIFIFQTLHSYFILKNFNFLFYAASGSMNNYLFIFEIGFGYGVTTFVCDTKITISFYFSEHSHN